MKKPFFLIAGLALASLSCQSLARLAGTQPVSKSSAPVTKLRLPQPWLDPVEGSYIEGIEVRKRPNSPEGEFFLGALPYGDFMYAHEADKTLPKTKYGSNTFALDVSDGLRVRVATMQEWESGSRIPSKPRRVFPKGQDDSAGDIEYRNKSYAKVGKYWGEGLLSPTGKWLAVFSYTGVKRPPDILFGGGDPLIGDIFWQIYDAITGKKVFEWEAKKVKSPTRFDGPAVWLEDKYFLFPDDEEAKSFNVVTLPAVTPEINPVTLSLPSRKDAAGLPLPAGASDEVWIPLVPLTKEQVEKLTARSETQITAFRMSASELLFAIDEETENRRVNRQQRDGAGDYHFRLINTYYYAIALDKPTQTRFVTKQEFELGQTVNFVRSSNAPDPVVDTVTGPIPPHRSFPKTGTTWGSPPLLNAREWIAVFSYSQAAQNEMFVDVYSSRFGHKLMTTALPFTGSPNELFKRALWVEGDYVLMPLNASLDSFFLWQLPGGM